MGGGNAEVHGCNRTYGKTSDVDQVSEHRKVCFGTFLWEYIHPALLFLRETHDDKKKLALILQTDMLAQKHIGILAQCENEKATGSEKYYWLNVAISVRKKKVL